MIHPPLFFASIGRTYLYYIRNLSLSAKNYFFCDVGSSSSDVVSLLMWVGVWLVSCIVHTYTVNKIIGSLRVPLSSDAISLHVKNLFQAFFHPFFFKTVSYLFEFTSTDGHILSLWQLKRSHSICAYQIFIDCSTLLGSLLVIDVQSARKFLFFPIIALTYFVRPASLSKRWRMSNERK